MTTGELLLSYLRWPVVILVLGLVFMFVQRDAGARLIDRMRRAWFVRFGAAPATPPVQAQERLPEPLERHPAIAVLQTLDSPLLREVQTNLQQDPMYVAIQTPEDRETVLLRLLAVERIALFFERTQRVMFGSQAAALRYLATQAAPVASDPVLKYFYEQGLPAFTTPPAFTDWLRFLTAMELVSEQEEGVRITPRGREFLKYSIDTGYTDNAG